MGFREPRMHGWTSLLAPTFMRNEARLALLACGFLNALTFEISRSIAAYGVVGAIGNTFGISIIVWAALFFSANFLAREADQTLARREAYAYLLIILLFLLPVRFVSWVGLTLLALSILSTSSKGSSAGKGAWILLALTFPMFWSKVIFSLFSGILLQADAVLVSSVLGMPRTGNSIALADGDTHMFINSACSSVANVSLVVLCWTIFCQFGHRNLSRDYLWCLLACCVIVAINVSRMSLIGVFPQHYDLLHGSVGASVASWLILIAMVAIFRFGMNRAA